MKTKQPALSSSEVVTIPYRTHETPQQLDVKQDKTLKKIPY